MVGFEEIIFVAVIALLLFGPDKLPHYIKELGKFYAEIKKAQRDFELELKRPTLESVPQPVNQPPSTTVIEIARKMNLSVDDKTEEQLLAEIDGALDHKST